MTIDQAANRGREEMPPSQISIGNHREAFSIWLDMFRWMAAFEVLLYHVRHRIFLPHSVPHNPAALAIALISSFGYPAVMIFFVLSGFLVGGGSLRRYRRTGLFDPLDYLVARLSRLWVVLLPTYLLTLMLNEAGAHLLRSGAALVYDLDARGALVSQDGGTFACNIAFLQTALCAQYGSNGALWSLFNEFWYYLAWPPLMFALWQDGSAAKRGFWLVLALAPLVLLQSLQRIGAPLAPYFLLWLLGVVAADRQKPIVAMPLLLNVALLAIALLLWRATTIGDSEANNAFLHDLPVNLLIAALFTNLIMLMKARHGLPYPPFRRIHQPIAAASFSLYCLHTPLIHFTGAVLLSTIGSGWHMPVEGVRPILVFAFVTIACMLVTFAFAQLTERHTGAVRHLVARWLRRGSGRAMPGA